MARVLVAFSEWLKLANPQTLDGAALAQHPLVAAALEGLNTERTFDGAVDAVVELVYVTSSGGQPNKQMLPLVARLVPAVRLIYHAAHYLNFQGVHVCSGCAALASCEVCVRCLVCMLGFGVTAGAAQRLQ